VVFEFGVRVMNDEITINFGADHLEASTLIESLAKFLIMFRSIETNISRAEPIQWDVIRSTMNSPLSLTLAPRSNGTPAPSHAGKVLRTCYRGLAELHRHASLPEGFDDHSLAAVREIAELTHKHRTQVTFDMPGEVEVKIDLALAGHAHLVVAKTKSLYEHGTIEGLLDVISKRKRDRFFVTETLTGNKVECFARTELFHKAYELFGREAPQRVSVEGRIKTQFGRPKSMNVETIQRLRGTEELPTLDDIGPMDLTGGLDSGDFVRGLRDA